MRRFLELIALIALAAGALVWWTNRAPEPRAAAGPSERRTAADAGDATSAVLPMHATGERESIAPASVAEKQDSDPSEESAPTPEVEYWGKLVNGETLRPISGAAVGVRIGDVSTSLTSDAQGLSCIGRGRQDGQIARVDAVGFGPVLTELASDNDIPERAVELVLWRAAAIDAHVFDASGAPLADAIVSVSASPQELARPEGAHISQPPPMRWSAHTGTSGFGAIENLPSEAPLWVTVWKGGEELCGSPSPFTLKPGERRDWNCRIGRNTRVFGVVLDPEENAVANQEVWLASLDAALPTGRYYFDGRLEPAVQRATTDGSGRFAFADVSEGTWLIGPAATAPSATRPENRFCPVASSIVISALDFEREVVLRVQRGAYIGGRVVQPPGSRLAWVMVLAQSDDPAGAITTQAGSDGRFTVGPFLPGELRLKAIGFAGLADSPSVVARAGDEDVVLALSAAFGIRLRAVDARSGEPCAASFLVRARAPATWSRNEEMLDPSMVSWGRYVGGMSEGTYDVFARTKDGRVGAARNVGVRAGQALQDIIVLVGAGARLRLRLEGREQTVLFEVLSDDMAVVADNLRTAVSKLVVVPAGPAIVRLRIGDSVLEERQVTALVGEEVEVVFRRD